MDVEKAKLAFLKASSLEANPMERSREPGHPVGLKVSDRPAFMIDASLSLNALMMLVSFFGGWSTLPVVVLIMPLLERGLIFFFCMSHQNRRDD